MHVELEMGRMVVSLVRTQGAGVLKVVAAFEASTTFLHAKHLTVSCFEMLVECPRGAEGVFRVWHDTSVRRRRLTGKVVSTVIVRGGEPHGNYVVSPVAVRV